MTIYFQTLLGELGNVSVDELRLLRHKQEPGVDLMRIWGDDHDRFVQF